ELIHDIAKLFRIIAARSRLGRRAGRLQQLRRSINPADVRWNGRLEHLLKGPVVNIVDLGRRHRVQQCQIGDQHHDRSGSDYEQPFRKVSADLHALRLRYRCRRRGLRWRGLGDRRGWWRRVNRRRRVSDRRCWWRRFIPNRRHSSTSPCSMPDLIGCAILIGHLGRPSAPKSSRERPRPKGPVGGFGPGLSLTPDEKWIILGAESDNSWRSEWPKCAFRSTINSSTNCKKL